MEFLRSFFNTPIYSFGNATITVGHISLFVSVAVLLFFLYRLISQRFLPEYCRKKEVDEDNERRLRRGVAVFFTLLGLINVLLSLNFDAVLYSSPDGESAILLSTVFYGLLLLQLARLLNLIFVRIIIPSYYNHREDQQEKSRFQQQNEDSPNSTIQSIIYIVVLLLILYNFNLDWEFYNFGDRDNPVPVKISNVLYAALIILGARIFSWTFIQLFLFRYYKRKSINAGSQYAINQLLKYTVFVIAILMAVEAMNINLTVLWAGSAALLVGLGLGLQQTFNDLISGIILLFERTLEVGDFIQVDDDLSGQVRAIGWRTSEVETVDGITVVVPNSRMMSENVINWSHSGKKARFRLGVGVAYGSDTQLVRQLLLQAADQHDLILKYPKPNVQFTAFADSSLNFDLLFWSRNFLIVEDIKSDLRFEVDRLFRENEVEIPFPQRDVWIKSAGNPTTS